MHIPTLYFVGEGVSIKVDSKGHSIPVYRLSEEPMVFDCFLGMTFMVERFLKQTLSEDAIQQTDGIFRYAGLFFREEFDIVRYNGQAKIHYPSHPYWSYLGRTSPVR